MNIEKPKGATTSPKVLGRGTGTGKGCTAGKGTKGQNSRSGGGTRLGFEGGQMPLFRRVARRGFSNYPFKKKYLTLKVGALGVFKDGDIVNRETLASAGLILSRAKGKVTAIKILAGELRGGGEDRGGRRNSCIGRQRNKRERIRVWRIH